MRNLLLCQSVGLHKNYLADFTKFSGKVARGTRRKLLDFGGNVDQVMLGLELWQDWGYGQVGDKSYLMSLQYFVGLWLHGCEFDIGQLLSGLTGLLGLGGGLHSTECHSSQNMN